MRGDRQQASGFTLIELLVSLVIGLIVTGSGVSLYVQSTSSRYLLQAELTLQENSYYIDQTLRLLINQAGHRPLTSALLSTPRLPIRFLDKTFVKVTGKWEQGEFVRVVAGGVAIRFAGSSDDAGEADGTIVNCQGEAVAEDETTDIILSVADGALSCSSDGQSVELVGAADGVLVEKIAVLWGMDTNNDNSVDEYIAANNGSGLSENLLAVRMLLLLSSKNDVKRSAADYTFNGIDYTPADLKLRKQITTTLQVKN